LLKPKAEIKQRAMSCTPDVQKYSNIGMRQPNFSRVRVNNIHTLQRPSYRAGTKSTPNVRTVELPPQIRSGIGNRNITRINFTAPRISARNPVDFDKLNAVNLAQFGNKVQLSDKTINELIRVNVPDERDFAWLAEKRRLVALGSDALPFGRKQREVQKRINFGKASLGLQDSIAAVSAAVDSGIIENRTQQVAMGVELAKILSSVLNVEKLSNAQMAKLTAAASRLSIPKNWRASFSHRFWTASQIRDKSGELALYLLSTFGTAAGRSPNKPLMSYNSGSKNYVPMGLQAMFIQAPKKGADQRILDIQTGNIEPISRVLPAIRAGEDGGRIDGKPLAPPKSKSRPPPLPPKSAGRPDLKRFISAELRAELKLDDDEIIMLVGNSLIKLHDLYDSEGVAKPADLVQAVRVAGAIAAAAAAP
jgi:hypothetical protein